jgi:hypothetical protein
VLAAQTPGTPAYVPPPPEQPLPFSHQTHLALSLECEMCHVMPDPGDAATFPATETCMGCHTTVARDLATIQQLAASHEKGEPIPWRRVYNLPDYVYFSHKPHVAVEGVSCETCHGPVREMPQMQRVRDISMAACVDCHTANQAPTGCSDCHEPR